MEQIKITMTAELAQNIFNLLGEMPAKASAKALLEFAQVAQNAEKVEIPPPPPLQDKMNGDE